MKGTALVPRCGPCQRDMVPIVAQPSGTPAWYCEGCRAWTPRKATSPYRKG